MQGGRSCTWVRRVDGAPVAGRAYAGFSEGGTEGEQAEPDAAPSG